MELIISGDFFISEEFKNDDLIDASLSKLFSEVDYRIVNLESPITKNISKNKILKTGPHLRTSSDTIFSYFKQLKIDAVTLANNHLLDYGINGFNETICSLEANNIEFVGAGKNLNEAREIHSIKKNEVSIAIINIAENEWSIADENECGANPLDLVENVYQIRKAKKTHNKIICIVHGGHEFYKYPSPRMIKQYRFLADSGADAVICHHSHCISGYEIYKGIPIIYGLGNFIFTLPSPNDSWYIGLLCRLKIYIDKPISFELIPIQQRRKDFFTSIINEKLHEKIIKEIAKINDIIKDKKLLANEWQIFINTSKIQYLNSLSLSSSIHNRYLRFLINRIKLLHIFMNKRYKREILNIIRCEAHLERFKAVLERTVNN